MPFCRNCGSEIDKSARFCAACGATVGVLERSVRPGSVTLSYGDALSLGAHVVNLLACFMLVIGPFLPWATAVIVSASGIEKTGNEALVITLLGIVGIAVSAVSLAYKRNRLTGLLFVVGVISLALSVYYYFALRDQLSGVSDDFLPISTGAGIYVCIVASVVVLVAAFTVALRRK